MIKKRDTMKKLIQSILFSTTFLLSLSTLIAQEKEIKVDSFDDVIISPHIEATLVEGDREMVVIEDADVPLDKLNVVVDGNTLKIYLDGAKTYTKSKKVKYDDYKGRYQLYDGTMITATITYKHLKSLQVRGDEDIRLVSPIDQKSLDLTLYGESEVHIGSVKLDNLKVVMYGESYLKLAEGEVGYQKYKAFGESEVHALGISNRSAKITAYGESEFMLNVSDRIKVTSYGESEINYRGNPTIDKGVVLGENSISRM